ncbi:MAG: peptidylprolyl isomerase [Acidobacteria bacterium]|nr:peptidylprolyl isomerase [Acidobacteriota bacterium]
MPDVVARVNGEAVTKIDFDRLIRNIELGNGPIPAERRDEIMRRALDQLVTYTVLTQEAKARNITVTDAELEARVTQMRSRFPTEPEFIKALEARNTTLERFRADARIDMVIGKMMEAEVSAGPPPTDAELREFYDKNPNNFKQNEAARASHILIMVDEKADPATNEKARATIDDVLKRARAGEDFATLARQYSQDGSAAQGGDLGFFTRGQMVPAFDKAAFALKPGEISDVVTTQFGHHVIKMAEQRPASTVPFEEASAKIKQFLTEQKKQQRASAFIADAKKRAKIEVLV